MTFSIHSLTTYNEMLTAYQLHQEIWGLNNPQFGIYPPIMNTVAKNGGVVLGAFDDKTGQMVAFLFSFIGREGNGPFKLCSQVMGVLPAWRGFGVAEALKQTQRQRAIEAGLPLITWTFDPLAGPNAHLNLHKLRAISRRYWRDVYGSNFGALNAGLPTDRLLVEWWVQGRHVDTPVLADIDSVEPVFELAGQDTERYVSRINLSLQANTLQLETVADIHLVKAVSLDLALDWRLKMREAFETYFDKEYIATDFVSQVDPPSDQRHNRYLLQKITPQLIREIGLE